MTKTHLQLLIRYYPFPHIPKTGDYWNLWTLSIEYFRSILLCSGLHKKEVALQCLTSPHLHDWLLEQEITEDSGNNEKGLLQLNLSRMTVKVKWFSSPEAVREHLYLVS